MATTGKKRDGLQLRGRVWWVSVTVRGRRVVRSAGTERKEAAKEYRDRLKAELWREGVLGDAPKITWQQAASRFMGSADFKSLRDQAGLRQRIEWWSAHFPAAMPLASVNRGTVTAQADRLEDVSGATRNRYVAAIGAVLRYSEARGWITAIPKLPRFSEGEGRLVWLSHEEADKLLAKAGSLAPLIRFSLATGLRQSNVLRLRWEKVDLERRLAWVEGAEHKNRRPHAVPLSDEAMAVLLAQMGQSREWVFPGATGEPWVSVNKSFRAALIRAGLRSDFTWHGLRHTWATWHVMSGTPLEVLMKLGGWSSLAMVMRYAHLAEQFTGRWANNTKAA